MSWLRKDRDKTEHGYVAERLSAYLDGQLTSQEQAAVDRHVTTCEVCRWDLATLRQTVQWTRELPTVPVPRVFTIPVEAQPERPARRPWRLVPVLQGATALVALLLFFVVAGDVAFRGAMPALAPALDGMVEQQAVELRATQVVEVAKEMEELPLALDAAVAEKAVSEPEAVPLPQAVAPTGAMREAPLEAADEAPKATGEELEAVGSEPQGEAAGAGEAGSPPEAAEEEAQDKVSVDRVVTEAGEVALTPTHTITVTEGRMARPSVPSPTLRFGTERTAAPTVVAAVSTPAASPTPAALSTTEATPTPLPTATAVAPLPTSVAVEPTPVPTEAPGIATASEVPTPLPRPTTAPTIVAEAPAPAPQVGESWDEEPTETRRGPAVDWLRVFEIGLGMLLVFLVAATIVLMVQRRRA